MNKPLKILFVVTQSEWGGAQKYIYDLATHMPKDDIEVCVASGKGTSREFVNKMIARNIKTYNVKHLVREIHPLKDLLAIVYLAKLLRRINPDILHLNSSKASVIGSIAGKLARIHCIVYTAHGWVFNEPNAWWKNVVYYFFEKMTARFKTAIICVSQYDKKIAHTKKIKPKEKIITIHNGIDVNSLEFFDRHTARHLLAEKIRVSLDQATYIVGTIANLYKTKGIDYLIEAAVQLPDKLFIVLGEGPERKNLEYLVRRNELTKRFLLPGTVKRAYQYLKAFDVFVLPSVKEGFPYVLLEASAARIPIVATGVGGVPEILPLENIVSANDAAALALKLSSVSEKPQMVAKATSLDHMLRETKKLYQELSS